MNPFAHSWPFAIGRNGSLRVAAVMLSLLIMAHLTDRLVTDWVATWREAARPFFEAVTRLGKSDWILIPALLGWIAAGIFARALPENHRKRIAFHLTALFGFVFAGIALPGLAANLFKRLIGRARPEMLESFGVLGFQPIAWSHSFQSFPSGHTTTSFALAMVVGFVWPRLFAVALFGAALIGFSRIALGVHFPSDVMAGMFFGILGAYAVRYFFARRGWLFLQGPNNTIVRKTWPAR